MNPSPDRDAALQPITAADSVVVLIDFQPRLLQVIDRSAEVVAAALRLAEIARELEVPVIGTEQNPDRLGPSLAEVGRHCSSMLSKLHFDACAGGLLDRISATRGRGGESLDLIVAGCEAHVCVLQTAFGMLRAGHRVRIVPQACGSRRADDHRLAMQRLQQAGATLVGLDMVAFEWLQHCRHDGFRRVLPLLKPGLDERPAAV